MASRTKAALATSAADQELQAHLADARRSVDRALDVCRRVGRSRGPDFGTVVKTAARQKEQALRQLLHQIQSMGSLDQGGGSDPDLAPEISKVPPARARREAANLERSERRKAERTSDRQAMKRLGWTP